MINYTKRLNKELRNITRNFNRKIDRLKKKGVSYKLPEKIYVSEIKTTATSRKDLRKMINDYKKFTKRNSERNLKNLNEFDITKWEYNKIKRDVKSNLDYINREIDYLSKKEVEVYGKKQNVSIKEMGSSKLRNLERKRDRNMEDFKSKNFNEFKTFRRSVKGMKKLDYRRKTFRENYIKMMEENVYFYKYDRDKGKEIYNKLLSMSDDEFIDYFEKDKGIESLLYRYKMIHDLGSDITDNEIKQGYLDIDDFYDYMMEM